jgi:hypothetical protein
VPALFPPWSNSVIRASLVLAAGATFGFPALLMGAVRSPWLTDVGRATDQPIRFDHRHHVVDDGIDCRYCHTTVETAATAGFPATSVCVGCHAQIWNDSPQLALVRESAVTGRPIPWRRVHDLPDFVFFQHAPHVHAGVGCETCHGRVDRMATVRPASTLTMGWCLDCHEHPEDRVRDPYLVTEMGLDARPADRARGALPPDRLDPPIHCYGCHR